MVALGNRWFHLFLLPLAACSLSVESLHDGVCDSGFKACDGECVTLDRPDKGCAAATCDPCALANADAICSNSGACLISNCNPDYSDCNGVDSDGCEIRTGYDVKNCGHCGSACAPGSNFAPACSQGACVVGVCDSPFGNCDQKSDNGCEVNLSTDDRNCGLCGNVCPAGMKCNGALENATCVP